MDGILNVNKPAGPSSFDVVRLVKRMTGQKRVGHGGTLDPLATGVLPVFIGQATRLSEFLLRGTKAYRAEIRLGLSTDTYDAEGRVVGKGDTSTIQVDDVTSALETFRGQIRQKPPAFSALKMGGKRLYKLAREGEPIETEEREVEVYRIELVGWSTPPTPIIEIECGHGTYIRSIAHDLGEALGCGAHLAGLVRTRTGPFTLDQSLSVEALHNARNGGYLEDCLDSLDLPLIDLPAAIVDADLQQAIAHGKPVPTNGNYDTQPGMLCRAFNDKGKLIALLRFDAPTRAWRPTKVFER